MSPAHPTEPVRCHVVEDDATTRMAIAGLIRGADIEVLDHGSAEDFLAGYDIARPACLVLDIVLPGLSGLELLTQLSRDSAMLPTLVVSADTDVERVVTAIQRGAIGFQPKPPDPRRLLEHMSALVKAAPLFAQERRLVSDCRAAYAALTAREREVHELLVTGASTKQIALQLGLRLRTAHIHRTNVMRKFRVETVVELAAFARRLRRPGPDPDAPPT